AVIAIRWPDSRLRTHHHRPLADSELIGAGLGSSGNTESNRTDILIAEIGCLSTNDGYTGCDAQRIAIDFNLHVVGPGRDVGQLEVPDQGGSNNGCQSSNAHQRMRHGRSVASDHAPPDLSCFEARSGRPDISFVAFRANISLVSLRSLGSGVIPLDPCRPHLAKCRLRHHREIAVLVDAAVV